MVCADSLSTNRNRRRQRRNGRWSRFLHMCGLRLMPLLALAAVLLFSAAAGAKAAGDAPERSAGADASSTARAADDQAVKAFRNAAEALYKAVGEGDRLAAARSLQEAELRLRKLPMTAIATAEGIQALADSVAKMKRAMAAVSQDAKRIQTSAAELRLAADALAEPRKPLWLQYRPVLREDVSVLERELGASPGRVTKEAQAAWNGLADHYRLIRTAVALQREPYVVERGDAVIRYADRLLRSETPDPKLLGELIPPLREAMEGLFPPEGERPATVPAVVPPPWGFSATLGSIIVAILTWAGWRRFRFDRSHPNYGSDRERKDAADRWFKSLLRLPGSLRRARHARR